MSQDEAIFVTRWRLTFARVLITEVCNPHIYNNSFNLTDSNTLNYWPICVAEKKNIRRILNDACSLSLIVDQLFKSKFYLYLHLNGKFSANQVHEKIKNTFILGVL